MIVLFASGIVAEVARELARNLRRRQTRAQRLLWQALRNRKFQGKKFLRQHPIYFEYEKQETFFMADFYCSESHLVIEVDGRSHDSQEEYDSMRTYIINNLGITVVRFKNVEVENNLALVLRTLGQEMSKMRLNPLSE